MTRTERAIAAFAVAPFVPASLHAVVCQFLTQADFWVTVEITFWTSLIFTVPLTLAIGIPAYTLIEKHSTLRSRHVLGISGAVGLALGLLAEAPVSATLLGLSAGLTFLLIWHRDRDAPTRT